MQFTPFTGKPSLSLLGRGAEAEREALARLPNYRGVHDLLGDGTAAALDIFERVSGWEANPEVMNSTEVFVCFSPELRVHRNTVLWPVHVTDGQGRRAPTRLLPRSRSFLPGTGPGTGAPTTSAGGLPAPSKVA